MTLWFRPSRARLMAVLALAASFALGCRSPVPTAQTLRQPPVPLPASPQTPAGPRASTDYRASTGKPLPAGQPVLPNQRTPAERRDPAILLASLEEPAAVPPTESLPPAPVPGELPVDQSGASSPDDPFVSVMELPLSLYVEAVLQRNPTLQESVAAWQAASQRFPQEIALEDPVFQSALAPQGVVSSMIDGGYMVGIAQKVPWSGKRYLRGQRALAETNAAGWDYQDARLRLTESARLAYFDLYLAERELEVNAENIRLAHEFHQTALRRYESNLVQQQDVLQAEVELSELARRQVEFERMRRVAVARMNTLLHRLPDHPLPSPVRVWTYNEEQPPVAEVRARAVQQRPDLAAIQARIQAEQANVALACKEFYPDFEFMARYDTFWQERPLRTMIGMNVNIPLNNKGKRTAAVNEAMFRVQRLQAEYAREVDTIHNSVDSAYARLEESRRTVQLYHDRILPAAEANVEAALAGYNTGTLDFLRLIEAQRQLIDLRERHFQAMAEYQRRRAELERIVGLGLGESGFDNSGSSGAGHGGAGSGGPSFGGPGTGGTGFGGAGSGGSGAGR